jgi:SAM-dependent methyltransferase
LGEDARVDESLAAAWEAQAEAWARWVRAPGGDPWNAWLNWPAFAAMVPAAGRLTVDLGCGEGRVGRELSARGHRLVGVDVAPTMVARARDTGAYDVVHEAEASAVPLATGAADLVIAYMSLHDIEGLDGALREAARILQPGGRLCAAIVHPFASAHVGAEDERAYAQERRYAEGHDDPSLGIVFHGVHRPLATYVNGLVRAGLLIELVHEPVPSADAVRAVPALAKALARPPFLHWRAVRGDRPDP